MNNWTMNLVIMESLEVSKNILIVESENDKYFMQALIQDIDTGELESLESVCKIDDYECLGGMNKLEYKLEEIKRSIRKKNISKIGIVFDADQASIETREAQINSIAEKVFSAKDDVEIEIFILNMRGRGELETVLKEIKSEPSTYADCLNDWRTCLQKNGAKITDKAFDKQWVQFYQRYDCCSAKEKKQADKKCSNKASFQKKIWNFDHEILGDLKEFLKSF